MPEKLTDNDESVFDELAQHSFNAKLSNLDISYKFENSRLQIGNGGGAVTSLQDLSDIDSGVFCTNLGLSSKTHYSVNTQRSSNFNIQNEFSEDINKPKNLFEGIFGCIKPIFTMWSNKIPTGSFAKDDFEIPFENITDLQWIGCGAQGAVFKGMLNGEHVAVKKVKTREEANVKSLCRLQHPNLVKIKGVSLNCEKFFCIIMDYCLYGQLYTYLNKDEKNFLKPAKTIVWAKQVASAMNYLHVNKIIHRDLKSPNILLSNNDTLKITDFGASKALNEKSTVMSIAGTGSWMAPEVIRHEPSSEKADVWSYGVVLWEMLTCETPFKNFNSHSILWGVGNNTLRLHLPETMSDGVKLLLKQCWNCKPRNRPTFQQIFKHLDIVQQTDELMKSDEKYFIEQNKWKEEINKKNIESIKGSEDADKFEQVTISEQDLIDKRNEELKHASDIRELYERKLERANDLYFELSTILLQLDEREKEIKRKEKLLNINATRKRAVRSLIKRELFQINPKNGAKKSPIETKAQHPIETISQSIQHEQRLQNITEEKTVICYAKPNIIEKAECVSNQHKKIRNFYSSTDTEDNHLSDDDNEKGKDDIDLKSRKTVSDKKQYSPKYLKRNTSLRKSSRRSNNSIKKGVTGTINQNQTSSDDDEGAELDDDDGGIHGNLKKFSLDDEENRLKYNNSSLSSCYFYDARNSTTDYDFENTSERPQSTNSLDDILDDDICNSSEVIENYVNTKAQVNTANTITNDVFMDQIVEHTKV